MSTSLFEALHVDRETYVINRKSTLASLFDADDMRAFVVNSPYVRFCDKVNSGNYKYSGTSHTIAKKTLATARNDAGDRSITQADMDNIEDVPTSWGLKTHDGQLLAIRSGSNVEAIGVGHNGDAPFFVNPISNAGNGIYVNATSGGYSYMLTSRVGFQGNEGGGANDAQTAFEHTVHSAATGQMLFVNPSSPEKLITY